MFRLMSSDNIQSQQQTDTSK